MEKVLVEFTGAELKALQQLLNIAVQSRGLDVAPVAIILNQRIEKAMADKSNGSS